MDLTTSEEIEYPSNHDVEAKQACNEQHEESPSRNKGRSLKSGKDGRVWVSKFTTRKHGTRTKFELWKAGWKAFVKDNDLKVNDVSVFELIKGPTHELYFLVSIFPSSNPSDGRLSQGDQGQKNKRVKIKTETLEFQVSPRKPN
ncbi:hypothetical protein K1719_045111 [Acacia pycnantha]|nr:hypothetical protein K1719_045111 [Acacia pycnantha]